ncbi:MAG: hypothetical protein PW786_15220 [Arachidicoccus sp.]|nr:hypothetical protein [Arachidicoccus sp.]
MQINKSTYFILFIFFVLLSDGSIFAQINRLNNLQNQFGNQNGNVQYDSQGNPITKQNKGSDSLKLRDKNEDSITITFRYFDSSAVRQIDTTINDFHTRLQLPFTYTNLGNIGSPAQPLLFNPYMNAGWDAGLHSMDPYKFTLENTKYYTVTRPYSVLGYMLGQKGEQYIDVLHTQPRAHGNVNFTFEYRLLNAPGAYQNQNTANNNIRANFSINSSNKRYNANFIILRNNLKAATNGGLVNPSGLDSLALGDLSQALVKLGVNNTNASNPFNASVNTGNIFNDFTLYFREAYDLGQKDSIVKDTVTYRLFYPRMRFEHTIKYSSQNYSYVDDNPDVSSYSQYYNFIVPSDTVRFHDSWKIFTNEAALYLFPVKKNSNQYLKLYGDYQIIKGKLGETYNQEFDNIFAGADYRNKTRNQKWDMDLGGRFYIGAKNYSGNYDFNLNLRRDLGSIGALELGIRNVNQSPAYIYNSTAGTSLSVNNNSSENVGDPHSGFPIQALSKFSNQNITHIFANYYLPYLKLKLTGNYFLYKNYAYFNGYFTATQTTSPFNVLQIEAEKATNLGKFFHWYIEAYLQQKAGSVDLHVPALIMRNRIAFEGNFFKNLYIATGFEVRYVSPYKPDNYSPFNGQFFYQNDISYSNRPDVDFYLNFRITRFKFFAEYSQLNTINYSNKTFGFNHYNWVAPNYPALGAWLRMGVWWTFIN